MGAILPELGCQEDGSSNGYLQAWHQGHFRMSLDMSLPVSACLDDMVHEAQEPVDCNGCFMVGFRIASFT